MELNLNRLSDDAAMYLVFVARMGKMAIFNSKGDVFYAVVT
jgi:hypothetical protein